MSDGKTHECTFPEVQSPTGQTLLGSCLTCGTTAASAMMKLRGDAIRGVLAEYLAEVDRFAAAAVGANTTEDSERWVGHAQAREILARRLKEAGLSVTDTPELRDDRRSKPSPRHANLVRNLHVLEVTEIGDTRYSACKADGYISADLAADPCPTLAALNRTDPPAGPPLIEPNMLIAVIYRALAAAKLDRPGWNLADEARQAAEKITEGLPTVDLSSEAAVKTVMHAITAPVLYAPRNGDAVPGHQARAVLKALREGRK